nr:PREDICTED: receptor-like protein 12 [Daucus carota subsp. sativus]
MEAQFNTIYFTQFLVPKHFVTGLALPTRLQYLQVQFQSPNQEAVAILGYMSGSDREIGKLKKLLGLDLSRNHLTDSIPVTIGNPSLQTLLLGSNKFTGNIPKALCIAISLEILDLSRNNLSGPLPHCLTDISTLSILDLQKNQFQGTLPLTFTKSCQLTSFNINSNHFEGSVPLALANCRQLRILDLGNNKISGSFPLELVTLSELHILVLRSNRLHGNLTFSELEHPFPKLRIMDLSHNQLSGDLPSNFFDSFRAMMNSNTLADGDTIRRGSYYEASVSLTLKGKDEVEVIIKRVVNIYTSIDLSSNNFSGKVP